MVAAMLLKQAFTASKRLAGQVCWILECVPLIVMYALTAPYHRFFHFNTRKPLQRMAERQNSGDSCGFLVEIRQWRELKIAELEFSFVASGLLTAAFIGVFSWQNLSDAFWLTTAVSGCGLVFSILGVSLSAQQIAVLKLLGPFKRCPVNSGNRICPIFNNIERLPESQQAPGQEGQRREATRGGETRVGEQSNGDIEMSNTGQDNNNNGHVTAVSPGEAEMIARYRKMLLTNEPFAAFLASLFERHLSGKPEHQRESRRWRPRRKMVFLWQAPMMLMAYAVCFFLIGLTLYVCTPLIHGEQGPGVKTSIVYLCAAGAALLAYELCSIWATRDVSLPETLDCDSGSLGSGSGSGEDSGVSMSAAAHPMRG